MSIEKYKFYDVDVIKCNVDRDDSNLDRIQLYTNESEWIYLNKDDVEALAIHYGLIHKPIEGEK